jgi:MHS family proline/betaine transporter-like MFS transporter
MNKEMRKVLLSGMIGNALEWYDFVLFLQFAPFIGQLFFPSSDPDAAFLAALGVFAVGFVMRPIGGVMFGYIGDKFGRKASIIVSILLMSIPTAAIGFLPTYTHIGIWAPILLTIIRLLQGLALGGGFSGCMTFIVEHSPDDKRGLLGSASMFSLGAGVLLGILVTNLCFHGVGQESFETWGWRIPFIISLAIGMIAFYIRGHVDESPVYLEAKKHGRLSRAPVREVLVNHMKPLLIAIALYLTVTVPFYTFTGFFSNFLQKTMKFSFHDAIVINGVAISFFMLVMPFASLLSDKISRRKALWFYALAVAFVTYPVFIMINSGDFFQTLLGECIFGIALGCYMAPIPAALVELFPTSVRYTGLSLSYNISAAAFGGTAPFMLQKIIEYSGSTITPALYIMTFVLITLITTMDFNDNCKKILAD